jgi:fructokinase
MTVRRIVGGIELGGTKTVLAIGQSDGTIIDCQIVPTGEPAFLINSVAAYFSEQSRIHGTVTALSVGAFGPIVLDPTDPDFGHLLETNKPGWSGFDLHKALNDALGLPVSLVTDVGAAAIGEAHHGALRNKQIGIYLTVGTGIGGAILCNGVPLPALLHPELGHVSVKRFCGDAVPSICRFHEDCVEGLASGPAIFARFGQPLNTFASDSPQIALVANYLGQLCASLTFILSPQRIVIGGGVMKTDGLMAKVRAALPVALNGYASTGFDLENYLCPPSLGDKAGIVGALICAALADSAQRLSVQAGNGG